MRHSPGISTRRPAACGFLLAAHALTIAGCGDGLARVSGTVRIDGELFEVTGDRRGLVTFQPSGGGPVGTGKIDERGRFNIVVGSTDGLPPGEYHVAVKCSEVTYHEDRNIPPRQRLLSPAKYATARQSGFVHRLEPGGNTVDLALTSE